MTGFTDIKITKSNRKTIALLIHPDGTVEVRAPKYIPNFVINTFVKSKKNWIEERLDVVTKNITSPKKFINGTKFTYLGEEYTLTLGTNVQIEIDGDKLLIPLAMAPRGKEHLEKWYIKQAKKIIKEQVDHYAKALETTYNGISFSDTKSKWGSCTHDNRLQFNWRLIMAPLLVIRYVVIHELVHTTDKNHKAVFWNKVRKVNPSYKQQIKWLKQHGGSLIVS